MDAEHTPATGPAATRHPILERKQKPDGSWREYHCLLLHRAPGLAVVEFVMATGGEIFGTPIIVPPGSISHGYFWARRPYNLYRMRDPAGAILAHRFDALTGMSLSAETIVYRDLALDWWVQADGTLIEEDRAEFETLVSAGVFSAADAAAAHAAERAVYSRYRHIIDEAARLEHSLGLA